MAVVGSLCGECLVMDDVEVVAPGGASSNCETRQAQSSGRAEAD